MKKDFSQYAVTPRRPDSKNNYDTKERSTEVPTKRASANVSAVPEPYDLENSAFEKAKASFS